MGLQDRANAEELVYLVLGGDVHEGALRGTELDPAVGLQALQGFSHRLPADAEVLGQFVLDEVLAPLQGAVHDQFHDRVVDGLAKGSGTQHPGRGGVGQHVALRSVLTLARTRGREVTWRGSLTKCYWRMPAYRFSYAINCLRTMRHRSYIPGYPVRYQRRSKGAVCRPRARARKHPGCGKS